MPFPESLSKLNISRVCNFYRAFVLTGDETKNMNFIFKSDPVKGYKQYTAIILKQNGMWYNELVYPMLCYK